VRDLVLSVDEVREISTAAVSFASSNVSYHEQYG
jgi:hypothetical protein